MSFHLGGLPSLGGWEDSNVEITPSDSTVFNKLCYVCGATYQSTLKQNSELEEALIYEGTKDIRRSFWNGGDLREANYRVVKVFYTKCPNCGASVKNPVYIVDWGNYWRCETCLQAISTRSSREGYAAQPPVRRGKGVWQKYRVGGKAKS